MSLLIRQPPVLRDGGDTMYWKGDTSGLFSVKSLYNWSSSSDLNTDLGRTKETAGLLKMWACVAPEKLKYHACGIIAGFLVSRGMISSSRLQLEVSLLSLDIVTVLVPCWVGAGIYLGSIGLTCPRESLEAVHVTLIAVVMLASWLAMPLLGGMVEFEIGTGRKSFCLLALLL
ncbi:hypothetical protein Dimus_002586 [Dionaea muscipula]